MKSKKINIIFILFLTALVLYIVLKDNLGEKIGYLLSINPIFLLIAFLMMVIYWILKGLVLYNCTNKFKRDYTRRDGIYLMVTTQFFHSITPFASGGQPWQVYKLNKEGLRASEGTTVAIEDFIAFQSALIMLGIIAVISNHFLKVIPSDSKLLYLVIVGFTLNIIVIVFLFILAFSKNISKKMINCLACILCRLRIVKNEEGMKEKTLEFIINFHGSVEILFKDKRNLVKIVFLNFAALTFQYLIPFVLMLGFGIYANPYDVLVASAYVMLIDSMMPTPGSTGGLEYGFITFFKVFIKGSMLEVIMIVWRFVTYYFGIIMGIIFLNIHKEVKE